MYATQANYVVVGVAAPNYVVVGVAALVGLAALAGIVIWAVKNTSGFLRTSGVLATAAGVGLLVYGIITAASGETPFLGSPAGLIGLSAGLLVAGIFTFVLSFGRKS